MENLKNLIKGKKKIPKFVSVYDKLYKMIIDGDFDGEEKLPSEPALAELMGVSRMTLRQAINLLQDDGIVKKFQGKGNFLLKNSYNLKKGLELLQHPVHSSILEDIDEVELEFNVEYPNDYARRILGEGIETVLFVDRWYKIGGKSVAYTLTMLSTDIIRENKIDLNNKSELRNFLENKIYIRPNTSKIKIQFTETIKFVSKQHTKIREKKSFLLEEIITLAQTNEIIHNKHYIPVNNSSITVERK